MKVRVELAKTQAEADAVAGLLDGLDFRVEGPIECETVWVSNASQPTEFPLVTYSDPSDQTVFIVIGKK